MTELARTRHGYDAVARRYATEISDELRTKPLDRAVLDALAELAADGIVADIGCGPGHVAAYLSRPGLPVIGLDASLQMVHAARDATALPVGAADMTALPLRSQTLAVLVCLYAVIHLDAEQRVATYREFGRVLRPDGHALIAFHTSDHDTATGQARQLTDWWGQDVDLTFRYLDPAVETQLLLAAGLSLVARLDRAPHAGTEHASQRSYLLVRRER